ncbi:hypothetical protein FHR99_003085 [Litorivivens lipolytica]|uniref:O-Antigen ligase n=1 Tax=Litorivivens lipolytica TaxID=1524264 RepID=A0A7W4Z8C0_9GAMM|nr:hypothetical protein [Litorivivens lipolytica]MBB3048811.1 hypothetical protein [Litorivivens lipolytica]
MISGIAIYLLFFFAAATVLLTDSLYAHSSISSVVFFIACTFIAGTAIAHKNARQAFIVQLFVLYWMTFASMPLASASQSFVFVIISSGLEDIFLAATLTAASLNKGFWKAASAEYSAIFLILVFLIYFVRAGVSIAAIASFREIFVLVAFYLIGRAFYSYSINSDYAAKVITGFMLSLAIFGIIERLFWNSLWGLWGATDYFLIKFQNANFAFSLRDELPQHWFTYTGQGFTRRLVSTVGDATAAARAMSVGFILSIIYFGPRKSWSLLSSILLAIAIFLTIGRGGMVLAGFGVAFWLMLKHKLLGYIALSFLAMAFILASTSGSHSSNFERHMTGLTRGLESIPAKPLGHGLGTSGTMAIIYSSGHNDERVEESLVGSIAFQTGVFGLSAYFIFFGSLIKRIIQVEPVDTKTAKMRMACLAMLSGILFTSFFASSAISPVAAAPGLLLAGVLISEHNLQKTYAT